MRWTEAAITVRNSRDDRFATFYPAQTLASPLSARSTCALYGMNINLPEFISVPNSESNLGWRFDDVLTESAIQALNQYFDEYDYRVELFSPARTSTVASFAIASKPLDLFDLIGGDLSLDSKGTLVDICSKIDAMLRPLGVRLPTEDKTGELIAQASVHQQLLGGTSDDEYDRLILNANSNQSLIKWIASGNGSWLWNSESITEVPVQFVAQAPGYKSSSPIRFRDCVDTLTSGSSDYRIDVEFRLVKEQDNKALDRSRYNQSKLAG